MYFDLYVCRRLEEDGTTQPVEKLMTSPSCDHHVTTCFVLVWWGEWRGTQTIWHRHLVPANRSSAHNMCSESQQKYFCPRLLDYIVIVGSRHPNRNNSVAQTPELLRRYPQEDHKDFILPPDVVFFCQPEGCISVGPKRMSLRESTSFVFTLTEKDSGRIRYGICVNFYRPFDKKSHAERGRYERGTYDRNSSQSSYSDHGNTLAVRTDEDNNLKSPRTRRKQKTASRVRTNTLTSLCLISHHPFFSTFRESLFVLRRLIDSCNERSSSRRIGASRMSTRWVHFIKFRFRYNVKYSILPCSPSHVLSMICAVLNNVRFTGFAQGLKKALNLTTGHQNALHLTWP